MMRKFTTYLFICTLCCCFSACDDDEASAPPAPSFTVDKTTGLANDTEFTFVVDEVDADAVTLLPYGQEEPGKAGILISGFTSGKATVKFTYNDIGTYNAVVVASNFTKDGESIERTYSSPVAITITSDRNAITAFTVAGATDSDIDEGAQTITLVVPYGTDVTTLKPTFTVPPFSTVTVGGVAQTSGTTVNNFTNPVTYRVTAANGTTRDYVVTVNVTPAENVNTVESISGTAVSTDADDRAIPGGYVGSNVLVIYDVLGTTDDFFDSVRVAYTLTGDFATMMIGGEEMEQDTLLDLRTPKAVSVEPQDPGGATRNYTLYAVDAPLLELSFDALNPQVEATTEDFTIHANVLEGTDVETLVTSATVTTPAGVTVTSITANGAAFLPAGTPVDFSEDVEFVLNIADANLGITYQVTYTASVTVVP